MGKSKTYSGLYRGIISGMLLLLLAVYGAGMVFFPHDHSKWTLTHQSHTHNSPQGQETSDNHTGSSIECQCMEHAVPFLFLLPLTGLFSRGIQLLLQVFKSREQIVHWINFSIRNLQRGPPAFV